MDIDLKIRFTNLTAELSPENLCCDGELSDAAVKRKEKDIMKRWRQFEQEAGRRVSEEEAENFWHESEVQAEVRRREEKYMAELAEARKKIENK